MEKTSKKEGEFARSSSNRTGKRNLVTRLSKVKYEEKVIQVTRVTKVVKGGKKINFPRHYHCW
jgi:ribosomal protein S5